MNNILDTTIDLEIEGDINLKVKTKCFEIQLYSKEKIHSFNYSDLKKVSIVSGISKSTPLSIFSYIIGTIIGFFLGDVGGGNKEKDFRIDLNNGKGLIFHFQDNKRVYKKAVELININITEANST